MSDQEIINELAIKITALMDEYQNKIEPYEIGHQLISQATSMLLYCAPNELVGVKTILACVENGIAAYETTHS